MNHKMIKLAVLAALTFGCVNAWEFRSPWISERGPIRYTFEKEDPDKYSLLIYSAAHRREAHKAFMSHGTDTQPLTALFFNKSEFQLKEIFPNCEVPKTTYYYNPYMKLATIKPRATYYEWGMNLGGRFEYPVYEDKGRIGVRLNVPFRTVEIEREDVIDPNADPLDDFIVSKMVVVKTGVDDGGKQPVLARVVRMDFVNEMFYLDDNADIKPALEFDGNPNTNDEDNSVEIFGQDIVTNGNVDADHSPAHYVVQAGVLYSKVRPYPSADQRFTFNKQTTDADKNVSMVIGPGKHMVDSDGAIKDPTDDYKELNGIGFFFRRAGNEALGYRDLNDNEATLKNLWLVLGRQAGGLEGGAKIIDDGISNWIRQYDESPYEWMERMDYTFETSRRSGLGDIDLDVFYEHTFSEDWIGEVMLGVRLPTGPSDNYAYNAYNAQLGNGEHWEIKLGGLVAWMPLDWVNIKIDSAVSFVLEGSEERSAVFEGSKIKNIGPKVDADVDWLYWTTRVDFTFFHPKTNDLTTVIGYELFYKTEDNLTFKKTKMESWLGKKWVSDAEPEVHEWQLNEQNLSNALAEANTEQIAHKVRMETSYRFSDWFEMFAGGSFTFAGKHMPRETDCHGGMVVRF